MARSARPRSSETVESLEARRLFATFTVNAIGDAGTGNGTATSRTLRQAINAANATSAADNINFSFTGTTATSISITSDLPEIFYPVNIDATSEGLGSSSGIVIQPAVGSASNGLTINGSNITVRRLTFVNFDNAGIRITGGSNNLIAGNYIGTNISGTTAFGNGTGVIVYSANNTIGGITATDRNVIAASDTDGVAIVGDSATGNVIVGNFIGYGTNGADLGNGGNGVNIQASGNRVGATNAAQGGAGARNIISGNELDGVRIEQSAYQTIDPPIQFNATADADDNVVAGNFIGTNITGESAIPNGSSGVRILDGERNTVGSADALGRNIISGNAGRGVTIASMSYGAGPQVLGVSQDNVVIGNYVGLSATGAALGNGLGGVVLEENQNGLTSFVQSNRVGGTAVGEGNVIGSNGFGGVAVQLNADSTTIQGNIIGLDPTGTAARPNGEGGVALNNSAGNLVGGVTVAARNVISGNTGDGVRIITTTTSSASADSNTVLNNYIGTNAAGTAAVANTQYGVRVIGGTGNVIGNSNISSGSAGNLISGNSQGGVAVGVDTAEFTERGTTANTSIQNNFIGTNAAATAALSNGTPGAVIIAGTAAVPTTGTALGGSGSGVNARGNLIVGGNFLTVGVDVRPNAAGTTVLGNRIGTNNASTAQLGGLQTAVQVQGSGVVIGSTAAGGGNTIGFATYGVRVTGAASSGVSIVGNSIGTNAAGTADLGNTFGVYVDSGADTTDRNITIGGTTAASANRIAYNAFGVAVLSGSGVEIVGNRIFNNDNLGIDLKADDVTPNDANDVDTGPNGLQNFPVLTSASSTGGGVAVATTINSNPNTALRIDYYAILGSPDASGHGESDVYLGSATVTTNASGNASTTPLFSLAGISGATHVTATATRTSDGSTSEFSTNAVIADNTPPTVVSTVFDFNTFPNRLTITFSENVAASLTTADLVLVNRTPEPDTAVPTANIALSYDAATNQATFTFPGYPNGILPNGDYRFLINAGAVSDAAGNGLATAYADTFFVLAGDANRDRIVDFNDFIALQTNYGSNNMNFAGGDFNYDGVTDFNDFITLQTNYNASV